MTSRRTSPPLALTVVGVETHIAWPSPATRWTLWLSYVGSIGEVVATGLEHDWDWSSHSTGGGGVKPPLTCPHWTLARTKRHCSHCDWLRCECLAMVAAYSHMHPYHDRPDDTCRKLKEAR